MSEHCFASVGPVPGIVGGAVRQLVDPVADGVERGVCVLERRRTSRTSELESAMQTMHKEEEEEDEQEEHVTPPPTAKTSKEKETRKV